MDLHAPLGSPPPPDRRSSKPVWIVACAVAICLVTAVAAYLLAADPHGGEPSAVALIPPAPAKQPVPPTQKTLTDPTPTGSIVASRMLRGDVVRVENGVKVISPGAAPTDRGEDHGPGPVVIDVSRALDSQARKSSSKPSVPAFPGSISKPRVAIFVGGLGLGGSQQARTAIDTLPAAVSLAFVPYTDDIRTTVAGAKAKGHEILLQLPMESAGGSAPGPHSLRGTEPHAELAADLAWSMSRFDGYAGVTNLLGASVTANAGTMTAVLKSVAAHGAYYLDDGTSRRSVASTLGQSLGVPTIRADVVLDATNDPAVVDANLERLVRVARARGSAIGMASGLSDHLATIARFTAQLDTKGIELVPVGDLARTQSNLATSR